MYISTRVCGGREELWLGKRKKVSKQFSSVSYTMICLIKPRHVQKYSYLVNDLPMVELKLYFALTMLGSFCSMARSTVFHEICVVLGHLMTGKDEKSFLKNRNIFCSINVARVVYQGWIQLCRNSLVKDCRVYHIHAW